MTREEAKQLLPIIKAYSEGKEIQVKNSECWVSLDILSFNDDPQDYRVKPEPKYRPFGDIEECWEEMLKHQPFGWLKAKSGNEYTLITCICNNIVILNGRGERDFSERFKVYTFADGTPFGVKVDEPVY